ncbi:MAG: signal peptidase I [Bacilli bacterium]|nr:signal peptidase I [Bacilli bacterium]
MEEQIKPKRKKITFNRIYLRVFLIGFFTFLIALLIYFKPYEYNSIKVEFVYITSLISIMFVIIYPLLRGINKNESSIIYRIYFEISDYLFLILGAVAILEIVFIFIIFPTKVNGSSMDPTLNGSPNNRDCILVQRIANIDRFDIIVLEVDSNINNISSSSVIDKEMLIKRLIGMPGEEVAYIDGELYIDGDLVEEDFEKLNSSLENFTLTDYSFITPLLVSGKIPDDYYFVLGDNRSNSVDSRSIGLIHKSQIVGLARFRCNDIFNIEDLRK